MIRYITLDETGSFEKYDGFDPVRLLAGLIIDENAGNSLVNDIRKMLKKACESYNQSMQKRNLEYKVIYPCSLHGGDKNHILYVSKDDSYESVSIRKKDERLLELVDGFNQLIQRETLRFIEDKISSGTKLCVYEYVYPYPQIKNEEKINTSLLNLEAGSNLYESMAILSMFNNTFGRLDSDPDKFAYYYATRVYPVVKIGIKDRELYGRLYAQNENANFVITNESTYKSALSGKLYDLPRNTIYDNIDYEFNVSNINYSLDEGLSDNPLLYITDIICGYLRYMLCKRDESSFKMIKLNSLPNYIETRIYSNTDRLYTSIINNLKFGSIVGYYSALYDYTNHVSDYKDYYDRHWINKLFVYFDHKLNTDKDFQNNYICSLEEYYTYCKKLMTDESDYSRGLFIAEKILTDIKRLNDPDFNSDGRSAFLSQDMVGKNLFRFYDIILRGLNHQGAILGAEEIVSEGEKYKSYVGIEEYIEHKLRVVQFMFNSFQYKRVIDIYLKDVVGKYLLDQWEEAPIEKLKNALTSLAGSDSEQPKGYLLAGKVYSTLAQAYSFISCLEENKINNEPAVFFFNKALEEMKNDRANTDITMSYFLHYYLAVENKEMFFKLASQYFGVDTFDYVKIGNLFKDLIKEDSSGLRFALYLYIKSIRVFYMKEDIKVAKQLYINLYDWMNEAGLMQSTRHPWELIYKNMYEIGDFFLKNAKRNDNVKKIMRKMREQLEVISNSGSTGPAITAIIAEFKLGSCDKEELGEILTAREIEQLKEFPGFSDIGSWDKETILHKLRMNLSYMYN